MFYGFKICPSLGKRKAKAARERPVSSKGMGTAVKERKAPGATPAKIAGTPGRISASLRNHATWAPWEGMEALVEDPPVRITRRVI